MREHTGQVAADRGSHPDDGGQVVTDVPCHDLGAGRDAIARAAKRCGVAPGRLADVILAGSELLSNACEHGDDRQLAVVRTGATVEVRISNLARPGAVPPPEKWRFPSDPLAATGRGLAIVASVASRVAVDWDGDRVTVTAAFPAAGRPRVAGAP